MSTETKYSSRPAARVATRARAVAWVAGGLLQAVAVPLAGDTAVPGKPALPVKGEFSFSGTEQCAYASAFGPPPMLQAIGPVTLQSSTLHGSLSLAADGTGRLTGRIASLQAFTESAATPAMQSSLTCAVSHSLTATGELRLVRTCRGTRSRGTGSANAQTWTASPIQESGQFNGDTIVLADTQLAAESVSTLGVNLARLCHRAAWATRKK
jgi:hypothetical protein